VHPLDPFGQVLLALTAVVVVGRVLGRVFRAIGQPAVIGEVVGGIMLGPSLLGHVAPGLSQVILPPTVAPFLGVIAQLGVILYMFLTGVELNPQLLRGQLRATVAIAQTSIAVPFVLGAVLAVYLHPRFSSSGVPFTNFALFLGIAMSITAFPVLARILAERGMTHTPLGALALTCAAIDDVTAWCLLAFVVGVVQSRVESAVLVAALTLAFIGAMFLLVRPAFARLSASVDQGRPVQSAIAISLVSMLLAAMATNTIGVHALFGAFLLGAMIPHESRLARALKQALHDLVTILLLPAFFAYTGMRTRVGLLSGVYEWSICALIIIVATVGKFGGGAVAARVTGLGWRQAAGLGVLMNTRGLMELIVLNVGLDLGVISPTMFTMLVVMALVTTIATTPILQRLVPAPAG
jgi:Kef-type K+ transport system membrane component KefB